MSGPSPRTPASSRALRLGVAAGLAVAIAGYGWTRAEARAPDASWLALDVEVDGLDCAFWCSVKVQTAVEQSGAARVDAVDPDLGTVAVRYDPTRVTSEALAAAIEAHGFEVRAIRPR